MSLGLRQKSVREEDDWISGGRLFQRMDAAIGNKRRPPVARRYAGTKSRCDEDERRRWRPGTDQKRELADPSMAETNRSCSAHAEAMKTHRATLIPRQLWDVIHKGVTLSYRRLASSRLDKWWQGIHAFVNIAGVRTLHVMMGGHCTCTSNHTCSTMSCLPLKPSLVSYQSSVCNWDAATDVAACVAHVVRPPPGNWNLSRRANEALPSSLADYFHRDRCPMHRHY